MNSENSLPTVLPFLSYTVSGLLNDSNLFSDFPDVSSPFGSFRATHQLPSASLQLFSFGHCPLTRNYYYTRRRRIFLLNKEFINNIAIMYNPQSSTQFELTRMLCTFRSVAGNPLLFIELLTSQTECSCTRRSNYFDLRSHKQ